MFTFSVRISSMTDKPNKSLEALTRKVTNLDERSIDELYGLEPVYRPDEIISDRSEPTTFVKVQCPYCAEQYDTSVDLTAGSFVYVEDCQICCQPIELYVEVNDAGRLRAVNPQRMD
ncbi:MAG TPA: CPXCG motif-containing cysteine-rich protein [Steroidobacteraceae bacterium]|nr:CPXCG motif-containing cysteine-rich protein [Steroidobacteraceae bacterium]